MRAAKIKKKVSQTPRRTEHGTQLFHTEMVEMFRQASDPIRLDIVLTLADGERSVGELVVALEQSQPAISHHLALLRHGRVVCVRREGKKNLYSLREPGQKIVEAARKLGRMDQGQKRKPTMTSRIDRTLLEDVGGFVEDAERWFRTPNAAFEGRPPIDLLGTTEEARLRNRIEAAKLGMFS
jgi:DNA-binding transcriptional ArsR family regulator